MMRLRPCIPETDFDVIHNWISDPRTHALWCANRFEYPLSAKNFDEVLRDLRIRNGDSPFVALGDDGTVTGFFCYSLRPETNEGLLKFVIVDHRLRGQGIGGEMLRLAVRQIFDTTDAEAVHLNVFAENAAARRCYEKAGFTERDVTPAAFRFGDEQWSRCNMILRRRI